MLNIGKNNIFIYDGSHISQYAILNVLSIYDIDGLNLITLCRHDTSRFYSLSKSNKVVLYKDYNVESVLLKNLFKINLIIIESQYPDSMLKNVRKVTDLPVIIVCGEYTQYNIDNFEYSYRFGDGSSNGREVAECPIVDNKSKISNTLYSLRDSYIRDRKISELLKIE